MEHIRERKVAIEEAELSELMRQKRIDEMKKYLSSTETPLAKFDAALFTRLVDKAIIHSLVEATFNFRSRIENTRGAWMINNNMPIELQKCDLVGIFYF
jgi:hypothetical protein